MWGDGGIIDCNVTAKSAPVSQCCLLLPATDGEGVSLGDACSNELYSGYSAYPEFKIKDLEKSS